MKIILILKGEARIGDSAQIKGGKIKGRTVAVIATAAVETPLTIIIIIGFVIGIPFVAIRSPPFGQLSIFEVKRATEVTAVLRHGGRVHATPCHDGLALVTCHGRRHIGNRIVGKARRRPLGAVIRRDVDLGRVHHHAEIVIGDLITLFLLGRLDLLDPSGEGVVFGAAGDYVEVGKDVIFGGVHACRFRIAASVFNSIVHDAFHFVSVVVIRNVEEQLAVVGKRGMRIGIGVGLHVGDADSTSGTVDAAVPYPFFQFQIVTALQFGTAVNGDHGATVLKQ